MKHFFLIALAALTFTRITSAQPAAPSGEEILASSTQAYRALSAYRGECAVISQSTISLQGAPAQSELSTARAKFDFQRGQRFLIEGRDTEGHPFTIDNRGQKTILTWRHNGKDETEIEKELGLAVASMTGVAASAPTTIPALLLGEPWGFPFQSRDPATLEGRETVAGHACFVVSQKMDKFNRTTTFWIDSQNFLLRQMREEGGAWKLSAEELKDAPEMRDFQVLSSSAIHVFFVDEAAPALAPVEKRK